LPTAFATFVCEACKNVDFGFESARAPLRYEGQYYDRATDETVWLLEGQIPLPSRLIAAWIPESFTSS
jgi:hypothetical protein